MYPKIASPGGRKTPPTRTRDSWKSSTGVMVAGLPNAPRILAVAAPTVMTPSTPRTGMTRLAVRDHRAASGGCKARTKFQYIWPLNVTPTVQKIVINRGMYTLDETGPAKVADRRPGRGREEKRGA